MSFHRWCLIIGFLCIGLTAPWLAYVGCYFLWLVADNLMMQHEARQRVRRMAERRGKDIQ